MPTSINRIAALLLLAFALLAGALGYWVASGPALTARPDNPRRILAEQRILRGAILDRDGEIIVETIGESGAYARHTRYPDAAPFTGYYSLNYGSSGVEQAFDATLRGAQGRDPLEAQIDELLHVYPPGRAVQLTIDLDAQRIADALLGDRTGAVVVLSVPGADILALSSRPTFDPNTLDEKWDALRADPSAPLINRATQGQYQPGTAWQPILLSETLRRGVVSLDDAPEHPTRPFPIGSQALACRTTRDVATLADAFRAACPLPFTDLGAMLGSQALVEMVTTWGLTQTDVLGIQASAPPTLSLVLTDTQVVREFAAGQGSLTVTPLQMATVAATLATRGNMPTPRIVSATQATTGMWLPIDRQPARRILPAVFANDVALALSRDGDAAWHAGIGLSGSTRLLWFIGFAPEDEPKYAVAILIEGEKELPESDREALEMGQRLLAGLPR
jgi:peptidoglycan glycosyltransferase